jgi:hypothetical protein
MTATERQSAFSIARPGPLNAARCPQGLRPEIARIIEELARAAVRREDRRAREFRDRAGEGPGG